MSPAAIAASVGNVPRIAIPYHRVLSIGLTPIGISARPRESQVGRHFLTSHSRFDNTPKHVVHLVFGGADSARLMMPNVHRKVRPAGGTSPVTEK